MRENQHRRAERVPVEGDYLRLHKQTGQGYVILTEGGRRTRRYVGRFWADEAQATVSPRAIEGARRILLEARLGAVKPTPEAALTIAGLGERFMEHARRRYASKPTRLGVLETTVGQLTSFAGSTEAGTFGPVALRSFREHLAGMRSESNPSESRYTRRTLNERVRAAVAVFAWGVSMEHVGPNVLTALETVPALVPGEVPGLREGKKVEGVPLEDVRRVLPHLTRPLRTVALLQVLTGARPSELLGLQSNDIVERGEAWYAIPSRHKNAHRSMEHARRIPLSKAALSILRPFMKDRLPTASMFSPVEAMAEVLQERTARRETPAGEGNRRAYGARTRAGREPLRGPGDAYTAGSYRQSLARACRAAGVPVFTPYQLRHVAGELVEEGLDESFASAVLGHANGQATHVYHKGRQQDARAQEAARFLAQRVIDELGMKEVG